MNRVVARFVIRVCVSLLVVLAPPARGQLPDGHRIQVNGAQLYYVEQGDGDPIILLHGGQGDYRMWQRHFAAMAAHHRVIAYSRRYHFPNDNALRADYSALVDADDLAGLITTLHLGSVHLVGTSAGALTALLFALQHPTQVRSLVLAEPPILTWAAENAELAPLYRDFMSRTHVRAQPAFARGDDSLAVGYFIDAFDGEGTFTAMPGERRHAILQNARYFQAITASRAPYPDVSKREVHQLQVPTLVVRGADTPAMNVAVTDELLRQLSRGTRVIIPGAGHGSPRQQPTAFTTAVLQFIAQHE